MWKWLLISKNNFFKFLLNCKWKLERFNKIFSISISGALHYKLTKVTNTAITNVSEKETCTSEIVHLYNFKNVWNNLIKCLKNTKCLDFHSCWVHMLYLFTIYKCLKSWKKPKNGFLSKYFSQIFVAKFVEVWIRLKKVF